ncbi:MAG: hydroxylamine oxidase, partial [Desulfomonile tiedjei]|nr:hydroxylamine oxidase [Desulfomonile tiedjei]
MKSSIVFGVAWVLVSLLCAGPALGEDAPLSPATQECLDCHITSTPAMVADWKRSRHARIAPAGAVKKPDLERRVSAEKIPDKLAEFAVGCAECHTMNPEVHKDTFNHNEQRVHLTVTPKDCSVCHPTEAIQFDKNLMSHAWGNLAGNP